TQKTILVPILGDTLNEDDETFFLSLSQPKNADLGDKRAIGKITDNDTGGDKPGDSFETAVNLGKVKEEIIRVDQIGFLEGNYRDTDDYYRFQLDRKGTLVLTLDGLVKDANIDLYGNNKNELISQSNNDGISSEILKTPLDAGTYYVRVYPKSDSRTDYRLSVDLI
ncbi:MAG: pre-peptidase C-terminal domain-containing protein, partial [Planktothrix sp.]